jgi:hypothetical protein
VIFGGWWFNNKEKKQMTGASLQTSTLSEEARRFREQIGDRQAFFETCEGGDAGSPEAPSIWLLGLEPGWSTADEKRENEAGTTALGQSGDYSVERQLDWPFNRSAFKLLAALHGEEPKTYVDFAQRMRPFEKGCTGFFKGNLFPEPCNKIDSWDDEHRLTTGFDTKADYQEWMRKVRFPIIRSWIETCRPKLVICCGLSHLHDFLTATHTDDVPERHSFVINGHAKRMHIAQSGTVPIAVIPHLTGPKGLNSDEAIAHVAEYIRSVLGWAKT